MTGADLAGTGPMPEVHRPDLNPRMRELLVRIERAGRPPLPSLGVEGARLAYARGAEILDLPRAPLDRVEELRLPMRDGQRIAARLYAHGPAEGLRPVLLFLHGGGYVLGDLESHDSLCRQLALRSGAAVLALDYRRAPEHRFPTAVHDALDALAWLGREAARLGLDPRRLAVGGDSAGGTLAAVCAIAARRDAQGRPADPALPALRLQLLIYPACGRLRHTASYAAYRRDHLLSDTTLDWFFDHYADPAEREDWRFAPLLAPAMHGAAPLWMGLAACDPLHDDACAHAEALRHAGVPVTLRVWPGVVHDFLKMGRALPEALQAQAEAAEALRQALGLTE